MLTALVALTLASLPAPKPMTVLTFNIRYDNPADGENRWAMRRDLAVQTIRDSKAELIGLQEALKGQLDELAAALPDFGLIAVGREDGKSEGEHCAILYSKKRFKVLDEGTFWLSNTPEVPGSKTWGNKVTRICTWARLDDTAAKRKVQLYNLHLDHESQVSRERSIELLLSRLTRRDWFDPTIIVGDFNAGPDNPAILDLMGRRTRDDQEAADTLWWPRWTDAYRAVHPDRPEQGTYHGFTGKSSSPRIDFIFVSDEWKPTKSEIVMKDSGGKFPSDHFPVWATIQLDE